MRSKRDMEQLKDKIVQFILEWAGDPDRSASHCVTAWRTWKLYNEAAQITVHRAPNQSSFNAFNRDFEWIRSRLADEGSIEIIKVSQKLFQDFPNDGTEIPGSDEYYQNVARFGVESKVRTVTGEFLKDHDGNFQIEVRSPYDSAEAYFRTILPSAHNPARGIAIIPAGVTDHKLLFASLSRSNKCIVTRASNFKDRIARDVKAEQLSVKASTPLLTVKVES